VQAWNGVQILDQPKPTLHVYTDASGLKGLGGTFGDEWFSTRCPCQFRNRDIQFKEIYVVLQSIIHWGLAWKGHHIVFHVDNMAIVACIGSGTSRNHQIANVLRSIVMLAARLGFLYSCSWVSSLNNQIADAASRFEYTRLFAIAPSMQKKPCATHPRLRGIKHMLTCPPGSPSFYGTASPPRPARHIGQDRSHLGTSSCSTPNLGMGTARNSQHHKPQCSNGSHGWEQPKDFNPKLSSPISHIYGQPMSTRACNSPHVSRQCSNDSSEASKDTWASARGHPSCQSHATCSHAYSHRQATRILAAGLISRSCHDHSILRIP